VRVVPPGAERAARLPDRVGERPAILARARAPLEAGPRPAVDDDGKASSGHRVDVDRLAPGGHEPAHLGQAALLPQAARGGAGREFQLAIARLARVLVALERPGETGGDQFGAGIPAFRRLDVGEIPAVAVLPRPGIGDERHPAPLDEAGQFGTGLRGKVLRLGLGMVLLGGVDPDEPDREGPTPVLDDERVAVPDLRDGRAAGKRGLRRRGRGRPLREEHGSRRRREQSCCADSHFPSRVTIALPPGRPAGYALRASCTTVPATTTQLTPAATPRAGAHAVASRSASR